MTASEIIPVGSSLGSVSRALARNRESNGSAANELWDVFSPGLLAYIRRLMRDMSKRLFDENDIGSEVFAKCMLACSSGKAPGVVHRNEFLALLMRAARNKVQDKRRYLRAQIRNPPEGIVTETSFSKQSENNVDLGAIAAGSLTPELQLIFKEELAHLFSLLDERMQAALTLRLSGFRNDEIAEKLGRSVAAVERYFNLIRCIWKDELNGHDEGDVD